MDYDTIVIGFGKAGKTLAVKLSKRGEKVALIEKDPGMYGGTCINVGCIPSKRLVTMSKSAPYDKDKQREYYLATMDGKKALTDALRQANYKKLIDAGVKVIDGLASFIDKNTIKVTRDDGSSMEITGKKIVINTGSKSVIPNIKGVENNHKAITSEGLLSLETLPEKLTIIGGGYIGLEFASIYSNFGSKVTIIQKGDIFLPREDRDLADEILSVFNKKGISIITGASIKEITEGNIRINVAGEEKLVEGDYILLATGRTPNTDGLNLENAGVEVNKRGGIVTNDSLRTGTGNIWAGGDVCGNLQFTYISLDDSRIILSDMANDGKRNIHNRGAFAYSVFIEPAFSRVGLNEKEADDAGLNYRVVKMPAAAVPKAKVLNQTDGFLKVLIDTDSNKILGAQLFCEESYEIINTIKIAMDNNLDYTVLRDFIYTHPTMSEALNDLLSL